MKQPETSQEWLDYYEKLRQKNEDNYQWSGESRYDRAQYKYSCICDAFRARIAQEKEREVDIKRRMKNCDFVIDRLVAQSYSRAEVIEMLRKAVWW